MYYPSIHPLLHHFLTLISDSPIIRFINYIASSLFPSIQIPLFVNIDFFYNLLSIYPSSFHPFKSGFTFPISFTTLVNHSNRALIHSVHFYNPSSLLLSNSSVHKYYPISSIHTSFLYSFMNQSPLLIFTYGTAFLLYQPQASISL